MPPDRCLAHGIAAWWLERVLRRRLVRADSHVGNWDVLNAERMVCLTSRLAGVGGLEVSPCLVDEHEQVGILGHPVAVDDPVIDARVVLVQWAGAIILPLNKCNMFINNWVAINRSIAAAQSYLLLIAVEGSLTADRCQSSSRRALFADEHLHVPHHRSRQGVDAGSCDAGRNALRILLREEGGVGHPAPPFWQPGGGGVEWKHANRAKGHPVLKGSFGCGQGVRVVGKE